MFHHVETSFPMTTYHHHEILVNGLPLRCNDSQISLCVEECKRSFEPMDQQACVQAVEARWAPYSNCFAGHMTVIVRGLTRPVQLKHLKKGDFVLDSNMRFVEVIDWLHRDEFMNATFHVIEHETGTIWATPDHLIFDPIIHDFSAASRVTAVETVFVDGTSLVSKVVKSFTTETTGVYAPLTTSGTLMVAGVHVSCFTSPTELQIPVTHTMGQLVTLPYRWNTAVASRFLPIDAYCKVLYNMFSVH